MSLVSSHNEWDPLEEVIVGSMVGAQIPKGDRSLLAVEYADLGTAERIPSGRFPSRVVDETTADLERLVDALRELGVTVRRPEPRDHSRSIATPDWQTDGFYDYCPRDGLLVVGNTIIETPMVLRSRFLEGAAYKQMLLEYFNSGARWLSAPKPRLLDEMFEPSYPPGKRLLNFEPAFDAANIMRFGTDLLYLLSDSGNELGLQWLRSTLGSAYTVHAASDLYASTHVDSTIVPLRPGLVLVNPSRVTDENMPAFLRNWEQVRCPELVDTGWVGDRPYCSVWIGMNLLVVRPGLVIADRRQPALIRALESHGVEVYPLQLTHSRTLGGGFHCATLDVRRRGSLESYR